MTANLYDEAERLLMVYPNAAGETWPELKDALLRIARDKVAPLPFVPSDWYPGVVALAAKGYAPVVISPFLTTGAVKSTLPPWLASDSAAQQAWASVSVEMGKVVTKFAQGKLDEGRALLSRLEFNAAFWDTLYTVDKFIADAPANAVSAVASGAQHVVGGIFGSLFSSWLVWLAVGVGGLFAAWRFGFLKLKKKG